MKVFITAVKEIRVFCTQISIVMFSLAYIAILVKSLVDVKTSRTRLTLLSRF